MYIFFCLREFAIGVETSFSVHHKTPRKYKTFTVGENIIATTKIRNNYGANQSFIFPILHPFLYQFFASFLMASFQSYRSSNYFDCNSCRSYSLLKAIAKSKGMIIALSRS